MAGMLEELLAGLNSPNPGMFRMGKQPDEPMIKDYAQGVPMATGNPMRPAKTGVDAMDADLGRFQETNPVPPKPMPAQQPLPGMLSGMMGPFASLVGGDPAGAMPDGVGGNPPAPPTALPGMLGPAMGGAAPPLPPPINVAPIPAPLSAAPAAPAIAPPAGPPTDVSAQSRAPGIPPAAAAPPQSGWEKFGRGITDNSNTLLALGAGFAGAPSFGTGMSRAFTNAIPGGQLDRKNADANRTLSTTLQGQAQTYRALLASGVPANLALAAVQNPEIMKSVTTNYLGDRKKELKTIKRADGSEALIQFDPYSGTATDVKTPGGDAEAAKSGDLTGLTGDDFLAAVEKTDPGYARTLRAYVNGDIPLPSGRVASQPQGQKIIKDVLAVDPTVNANDASARYRAAMEFKQTGKTGKNVTNINTAIGHADNLYGLIDKIDNSNSSLLNSLFNPVRRQIDPKYQKNIGEFDSARQALSDELETAMRGGGSSVAGIKDWKETFDAAKSPAELKGAVQQAMKLLQGRLIEIGTSYQQAMGKIKDPIDFVRPENRDRFIRLQGGKPEASASSPAAPEPAAITKGLIDGTLKSEQYPQQAALLAEAKRRGLKIPGM